MNAPLWSEAVTLHLHVTSIRSRGKSGGVIFAGITDTNQSYVAKCDYRLIPHSAVVEKGQTWTVTGSVTVRSASVRQGTFLRHERVIAAVHAELLRPTGHNIVAWIANCPECIGLGQIKARRLYERFGPELVDLIECRNIDVLTNVVSNEAAESLCAAFAKFNIAKTLLYLDRIGVPRKIGQAVVAYWKDEAQARIEANPYSLVSFEADWNNVDNFACARLGISEDDPRRLVAAVEDVLYGAMRQGHTCLPESEVVKRLSHLFCRRDLAELALKPLSVGAAGESSFRRLASLLQSNGTYQIESYVARRLHEMVAGENESGQAGLFSQVSGNLVGVHRVIERYEDAHGIELANEQCQAIQTSAASHLSLILGGAGTGKTTVLKALYMALEDQRPNVTIFQLAPTGRAAQRMTEATGRDAMTIAAFLIKIHISQIDIGSVVVVDESSMIDVLLMYRLLRHLPSGVRLILVGDPSQLHPVGPGLVLHTLAGMATIPQTELKVVMRQSSRSGIPQVGAEIRAHQVPHWASYNGKGSGVSIAPCAPANIENRVQEIYDELGGDGTSFEVQILSITKADLGGVRNLNTALHNRYQKDGELVMYLDADLGNVAANTLDRIPLCVGDLVIFTENNYSLDLRNGYLGRIVEALPIQGPGDPCCRCDFDGTEYLLNSTHIQALNHAYSITVHKSQGSQFKRVIVPIRSSRLLDHALIYTAVTRSIVQVVLVGDMAVANEAIRKPANAARRYVALPYLLALGSRDSNAQSR